MDNSNEQHFRHLHPDDTPVQYITNARTARVAETSVHLSGQQQYPDPDIIHQQQQFNPPHFLDHPPPPEIHPHPYPHPLPHNHMVQEFRPAQYVYPSECPPNGGILDLQLQMEEPFAILGAPLQSRKLNEEKWQLLSESGYFAIVGASAVTHCYPINMTHDTERILTERFDLDVDRMYKELKPPESLTTQQKVCLQKLLEKLEKTWNASYGNMTSLHDASNRFMAFNTNVGAPASTVPSYLQHKFRALAHTALRILHLPVVDNVSQLHDSIPRSLVPSNLSFWKHISKRFGGDNRTILKGWLLMHFHQPYPSDDEKKILSQVTGMSRTQLGNWFINQRVRWWRPMVESLVQELELEEEQQKQKQFSQRQF